MPIPQSSIPQHAIGVPTPEAALDQAEDPAAPQAPYRRRNRERKAPDRERRTIHKPLRLTPAEWAEVKAKLGTRKWSEFVRSAVLAAPDEPPSRRPAAVPYWAAKIGANINQLAYHCNSTGALPQLIELHAIWTQIEEAVKAADEARWSEGKGDV